MDCSKLFLADHIDDLEFIIAPFVARWRKPFFDGAFSPEEPADIFERPPSPALRQFHNSPSKLTADTLDSVMSSNPPDEHVFVHRAFRIDHMINHGSKALLITFGIELIEIRAIAFLIEIREDIVPIGCRRNAQLNKTSRP